MWVKSKEVASNFFHFKTMVLVIPIAMLVGGFGGFIVYNYLNPTPPETPKQTIVNRVQFDTSVSDTEKESISTAIKQDSVVVNGVNTVSVNTAVVIDDGLPILDAYIPVTNVYNPRQNITLEEIGKTDIKIWFEIDKTPQEAIANALGIEMSSQSLLNSMDDLGKSDIVIMPVSKLSQNMKLLSFEGVFYLDSFKAGAIFRQAVFEGNSSADFNKLKLNSLSDSNTTLTIKQTGVTALTRVMLRKLNEVNDPLYFSKNIGSFLSDADVTHVSNEVSFKDGCDYSSSIFCSDPRFIETLKASGIDVVELTGNHNNDVGSKYNTETINLYHELGWGTFGGGLNVEEASKPYIVNTKDSKVAFLGYNYADSIGSGAIATTEIAGANRFDFTMIEADIKKAKLESDFVVVDVQYWECYSYPDGYVEFPICDKPISGQESVFKKIIDLGADMVVGSQAHQPQTYEMYKGKPIYYGLGNLYFDQTNWPGTERGIILTHYFVGGELVQTKLSPTIYGKELQTSLMTDKDAVDFLERLQTTR